MSILTNFLKLVKPEKNDYVDVEEHISNNLDKIDEKMENFNLNKLDKGGYTGTAQNLLTEISKIASKTILGRMIVGKGLTVDSSGRTSVVSKNDGIIVNDNDIQLNVYDGVDSTSTTRAGSARAVKMAYDKGVEGLNKADTKLDAGSVSTEYNTAKKIEDKIKEKIDKVAIVNDLITGGADKVGSAEMVKKLNENKLDGNSRKTSIEFDLNEYTTKGFYEIYSWNTNKDDKLNVPSDLNGYWYGTLIVSSYSSNSFITQILNIFQGKTYIRTRNDNQKLWTPWVELLTESSKLFLGNAGISEVKYIQDAGQKNIWNGYIDKTTGKLYICIPTDDNVNSVSDTTVTSNFTLATNIDNAKNYEKIIGVYDLANFRQTLNFNRYDYYKIMGGSGEINMYTCTSLIYPGDYEISLVGYGGGEKIVGANFIVSDNTISTRFYSTASGYMSKVRLIGVKTRR